MEKLREVAIPVIKQVYETQAEQFDHILVPISDGRLVYNVRVDLKEAYESESRNVVREFEKSILLHNIDDLLEGKPPSTRRTQTLCAQRVLRTEGSARGVQDRERETLRRHGQRHQRQLRVHAHARLHSRHSQRRSA